MARRYRRDARGRFSSGGSSVSRRPAFSGQLMQSANWSGSAKPAGTISKTAAGRRMDRQDRDSRQRMGDSFLEKGNIAKAREMYATAKPAARRVRSQAPQQLRSLTGTSTPRGSTISGTKVGREAMSGDKPVFLRRKRASRTLNRRQGPSAGSRYINS